jgi:hypothetical protein
MKAMANALVYAVTYVSLREGDDEDSDVGALEPIAGELQSAGKRELDALAAAAEKALKDEKRGPRRKEFIKEYGAWMENMFGEGWVGNKRAR